MMIFQACCTKLFQMTLFIRKTERKPFQSKTVIISSELSFLSSMALQTYDSRQGLILTDPCEEQKNYNQHTLKSFP